MNKLLIILVLFLSVAIYKPLKAGGCKRTKRVITAISLIDEYLDFKDQMEMLNEEIDDLSDEEYKCLEKTFKNELDKIPEIHTVEVLK